MNLCTLNGEDPIFVSIAFADDLYLLHKGNADQNNTKLIGNAVSTGTEYIARIRWKDDVAGVDMQITLYNTSMVQQDDVTFDGDITAFNVQAGAGDFRVGNFVNWAQDAKITYEYARFYNEWLDSDPNL